MASMTACGGKSGSSDKLTKDIETFTVNGVPFEMVRVDGGSFMMGSNDYPDYEEFDSEKPVHRETVGTFYIGRTEVTRALWKAVMGSDPSLFIGTDNDPVENVSWDDCQEFIEKLNQLTGRNFRLPSEAEWEYAARGGNRSQGYKYSGSDDLDSVGWYYGNSGETHHEKHPHPVATKQANELGIYDMSGNVLEWTSDKWSRDYNSRRDGNFSDYLHVIRGGSCDLPASYCRPAYRDGSAPGYGRGIGFRLALSGSSDQDDESTEAVDRDDESTEAVDRDGESTEAVDRDGESTEAVDRDGESTEAVNRDGESTEAVDRDGKSTEAVNPLTKNIETFKVNGVPFEMVRVDGGSFMMGSDDPEAQDDEKPVHRETVRTFWIGRTEVTQALWEVVMGSNPSYFKGANMPVNNVSWDDCQEFIEKLNQLTGRNFRLPSEAEWEYAALGGNRSQGYKYSGSNDLDRVGWYWNNSGRTIHPIASKQANELGIYDMSGNVWEWTSDKWGIDYNSPRNGGSSGSDRVYRGGSYRNDATYCRSAYRNLSVPDYRDGHLGLRLAL